MNFVLTHALCLILIGVGSASECENNVGSASECENNALLQQVNLKTETSGGGAVACNDLRTVCDADPFDARADCDNIHRAMRGFGTDEQALIRIFSKRSSTQRVHIVEKYKSMFGKDLIRELQSELSGNLEEAVLALLEPPLLYMAKSLRRAMRGVGADESTLVDIMMTLSNEDMRAVKEEYKNYYRRWLERDCASETSGYLKRLLVNMAQANRNESTYVDLDLAKKDAEDLWESGEGRNGADASTLNRILAFRSYKQLQATFAAYKDIAQQDILRSIAYEFEGSLRLGFTAAVMVAQNPAEFFADRLWTAMKGAGTDDSLLIRIIVERSEIDLQVVKQEFQRKYRRTLPLMIMGNCGGDYKDLLLALVGA